jgi:hypothetical protein
MIIHVAFTTKKQAIWQHGAIFFIFMYTAERENFDPHG